MKEQLLLVQSEALAAITAAHDARALEETRVAVLGKKGSLTLLSAGIKDVPPAEKG